MISQAQKTITYFPDFFLFCFQSPNPLNHCIDHSNETYKNEPLQKTHVEFVHGGPKSVMP